MRIRSISTAALALVAIASTASAQLTTTSPAGATLPSGVTVVGGIVTDFKGANGAHIVSQIAASSLYQGYAASNPQTIGSLAGFTPSVMASLGGSIAAAAFRFTLDDGDNASGNFDYNRNTLRVNGLTFAGNNWSNVATVRTTSTGAVLHEDVGFRDGQLMTGWFSSTDAVFLGALFSSLSSTGTLTFQLHDTSPYDNYYDFKQGLDGGLINVGSAPVVTPPTSAVPEPATVVLMGTGLVALAGVAARRRRQG